MWLRLLQRRSSARWFHMHALCPSLAGFVLAIWALRLARDEALSLHAN